VVTASLKGGSVTWATGRLWAVALLLTTASFLVLFDSLAVATALPSIGREFGLRPGLLQWVVSLHSLSIGSFLVLGGRVCDLWGRRRALVSSLALCTVAGLLAGLAPSLAVLLVGRVLQGLAAALGIPAALATAATLFAAEPWRSRVFSVIAFAAWSAGLGGAMLGGLLATTFGWRWVFLVTVPVGVVATVVALVLLDRDPPRRDRSERLDVWGALLVSAGLVTVLVGLQQLSGGGTSVRAVLVLCVGVVLLAVLVVVERRVPHPLLKPHLLRSRRMVGSCLAFGTYCAGYTIIIVIDSLYLQDVHGLTAAAAGLVLAPVLVGGIISSMASASVLRRYTSRVVVGTAVALCALALTVLAIRAGAHSSVAGMLPWLILWGLCSGPVYVGLTRECVGDAAEGDRGSVSAVFESTSHIGGAVAISAYLSLLGAGLGYRSTELVGAFVVASGAVLTFLILPRHDRDR
jgi:predicted MFS family arabinose efflux permease